MITYMDAKNADKYTVLFNRAADILKEAGLANNAALEDLTAQLEDYQLDWNNFSINSLNEYYAYLEYLLDVVGRDTTKAENFLRLPLDEEVLAINADTRAIAVPSSFSRYGVGVQGDELAETLYFTIDRYFDHTDLARNDIQIRIQWEAKDSDKNIIRGITKNVGKEIIYQEANKPLMVFGWPISSQLTQTDGTIKFAVRFYKLDGDSKFLYSFTTLPAEIKINASLDYNLSDNTLIEIDNGNDIVNRIKSDGIYDIVNFEKPNAPLTNEPGLQAINATGKIIDLPLDDSGIELEFSARPNPSGIISYSWNKFSYNKETGNYNTESVPLTEGIETVVKEITENIPKDSELQYYQKIIGDGGVERYQLISLSSLVLNGNEYEYIDGAGFYPIEDSSNPIHIYTKVSRATITEAGIYTAKASSRILINTESQSDMPATDGIKIPGPLKPEVNFPAGNTTLGEQDVYHVVKNENDPVTLSVIAAAGEIGKAASEVGDNPQVELTYDWKKVTGDNVASVEGKPGAMTVSLLPVEQLPDDPAWNSEMGIQNQQNVLLTQDQDTVTIYSTDTLNAYLSTNSSQNQEPHKWIALDINTGIENFVANEVFWDESPLSSADEGELNTGAGHLVFWLKVDEIEGNSISRTISSAIADKSTTLTFVFSNSMPDYSFNEDKSKITIDNLASAELDETYCVEVKATRNKISTTQMSGNYRITNAPAIPEITFTDPTKGSAVYYTDYFEKTYWTVPDSKTSGRYILPKTRRSNNPTLSFSVNKPVSSDRIIYAWMRLNYDDNPDEPILEPDFNGVVFGESQEQFSAIFAALNETFFNGGAAEHPDYYVVGDIKNPTDETLEISYKVTQDDVDGYYYCVVINELNGHINMNISPFFLVTTFH